jgi:DNA ligase D
MAATDGVEVEVSGRTLVISHPERTFFAERGETKLDLVRYYIALGEPVLRAIGRRPVMMERYPEGAGGKSWFQKRVPKTAPEWLTTVEVSTPNGTTSDALAVMDLAHVVWAVNSGCLGFHAWPTRVDRLADADELRIDLDPTPGVTLEMVREAAHEARALLTDLGLVGFPKTTGRRGIHIYVRVEPGVDSYAVRAAAVAFARELERRRPDLLTAAWWKEERGRRVFVDYNQNAPHKTVFAAWGARPQAGGQVSTPFRWDELERIDPEVLTIASVPDRVRADGDPWAGIDDHAHALAPLLEMSERDLAAGMMDAPWPPVYPKMPNEPPRVAPSRARKPAAS